jgi:pimeloyl-ACP methyl ester carboxylesterase
MSEISLYKSTEGQRVVMMHYDRLLARWPVSSETVRVATRYGETFGVVSGQASAPPLVLLHGANSNALAWGGDVTEFSRFFRTYALDVIGEPGRSAASRPPWTGPAYAEWLTDVLDGLNLSATALVGISQGGWLALKFATQQPARVTRLVLLAPGGIAAPRLSFLLRAIPLSFMGRWGAEAINRIVFGRQPIAAEVEIFMNEIMTHFRPRIEPQPLFTDGELAALTMPILLLAGAEDALLPSEKTAGRLSRLAPDVTARILPHTGHVLHMLAPEIVPFLVGKSTAQDAA